jgi:hypothetical protein
MGEDPGHGLGRHEGQVQADAHAVAPVVRRRTMMVMAVTMGVRSMAMGVRRVIMPPVIVIMVTAVIMLGGVAVMVMFAAHGRDFPAPAPSARKEGRPRLTPGPA